MGSIWGYLLWWEKIKELDLITLKKGYGINYKSGRRSFFLKWVKRFY